MKHFLIVLTSLFFTSVVFAETTDTPTPVVEAQSDVAQDVQAIYLSSDLKVVPKTEHEENLDQHMTIDVSYPQIEGENIPAADQQFNHLISDMAHKQVEQFKKYVTADMVHMQTLPEEVKKNTFHMDYDIDITKAGKPLLMSVRLSVEGFQAGRAHPYHAHEVLNFNLETGKEIKFNELFKPNSKYLNVIAKYCNKKLNGKLEDKTFIEEGTKPVFKNFKNWNLEDDDLLITFDEYQVAPYVFGRQEVQIPYVELKSIISPKAPIYPCVKNPKSCVKHLGPQ